MTGYDEILKSIEFEEQGLEDVLTEDGNVNYQDIRIAFDGIRKVVKEQYAGRK